MTGQGGTVRYHRAIHHPDSAHPWSVWFTEDAKTSCIFTAEQGEAMGLTPPEPAPLVVECNGHSIESGGARMTANDLADRLDALATDAEFNHFPFGNYELGVGVLRTAAALLRQQGTVSNEAVAAVVAMSNVAAERDEARRQLDTLRNAIGDADALLAVADGAGLLPGDAAWLRDIADAVDALAAAGGGVPEEGATDE